jgi:predicted DNA-binding transcriptional regulator YafY
LNAHCHQRKAVRNFRLDRIEALELLSKTFSRPSSLNLHDSGPEGGGRDLTIRVLFDPSVARWVRESRYFFVTAEEDRPDGLLITLKVRQEAEALQWLLGWGSKAKVLEPESLRQTIAAESQAMLRNHK